MIKLYTALFCLMALAFLSTPAAAEREVIILKNIADAPNGKSISIDLDPKGTSQGDMFVFEQPLIDLSGTVIGTNNGYCVMTVVPQFNHCQWTLTFKDNSSLFVGGEEANSSTIPSVVPVLGGTKKYFGASGELESVPSDGKFIQTLKIILPEFQPATQ